MELSFAGMCSYWDGLGRLCRCLLHVYREDKAAVVVATEVDQNPGSSITNSYEYLARGVSHKLGLSFDRTTWIEHYRSTSYATPMEETFDWVIFHQQGDCLGEPTWRPGTRQELEELIGQAFKEEGR